MQQNESKGRKKLAGRRAIVTGGTRGIGFSIAKSLLEQGAKVAICGRNQQSLAEALEALSAVARIDGQPLAPGDISGATADISSRAEVDRFFASAQESLGGVDILINNAGAGTFRSTADLSPEDWDRMIALNLSGPFYCSHAVLPAFQRQGGGDILNISSLAGKNAFAGGAGYNASKFGLNGFSEAMMLDHREDGVRVSYIMPGSVDTGFGGSNSGSEWKIAPEDVADVALMLLQMPQRTCVSRVEIRPSRPPQKS